jgi:hypothetical protein
VGVEPQSAWSEGVVAFEVFSLVVFLALGLALRPPRI